MNHSNDFHTLFLLDIKVREQLPENLAKGINIYEPPRYMTINEAIDQLFYAESIKQLGIITEETRGFGCARIGLSSQQIISGTLKELSKIDFGGPLHSLIICNKPLSESMHDIEEGMYDYWNPNYQQRREQKKIEKEKKEKEKAEEWIKISQEKERLKKEREEFDAQKKLLIEQEKKKIEEEKLKKKLEAQKEKPIEDNDPDLIVEDDMSLF